MDYPYKLEIAKLVEDSRWNGHFQSPVSRIREYRLDFPGVCLFVDRLTGEPCPVLRDDGMSHGDYVEQLNVWLFLKMADDDNEILAAPQQ